MQSLITPLHYILADDFTGANDVGVAFASAGLKTQVHLANVVTPTENNDGTISVICSNSRDLSGARAKLDIQHIIDQFDLTSRQPLLIKKVDSTLRGNIGDEIEACLERGYQLAIVAIAAPNAGRTTKNGLCYVRATPLAETEFASDPKSPIRSSRIQDIIQAQTNVQVCEMPDQKGNRFPIEHYLTQLYDLGNKIIVCDGESLDDLKKLYQAASELKVPIVFVTTGEIGQALLEDKTSQRAYLPKSDKPILAIIGSMSEATITQTDHLLAQSEAHEFRLQLDQIFNSEKQYYQHQLVDQALAAIAAGQHTVIRSCYSIELRHQLPTLAQQLGITQNEMAEQVRDFLADTASQIISALASPSDLSGLLLCGGDIAIAVANILKSPAYQIRGMVAGCVPWGYLPSDLTPFPVFTKAGGFGNQTTFLQIIQHINKEVQ